MVLGRPAWTLILFQCVLNAAMTWAAAITDMESAELIVPFASAKGRETDPIYVTVADLRFDAGVTWVTVTIKVSVLL